MEFVNDRLQEYKKFLNKKTVSVIGVGISNIPLINFLLESNAIVTARDVKNIEKLEINPNLNIDQLKNKGVKFVTGENYLKNLNEQIIYKSPGIRFDKPEILNAHENGSIITSEMEAFISLCPAKIFAVTGSNGKTTTTSLIARLLENAGKTVWLGGNIGKPLLSQIDKITPEHFVVLELSSFQLHTINRFENNGLPFSHITFPDVAIITNISENHLDWHTDMDEYALAKKAIFSFMGDNGRLVINRSSDEYVIDFSEHAFAKRLKVEKFSAYDGITDSGAGISSDGKIYIHGKPVLNSDDIILPGLHNRENYMAAILSVSEYVTPEVLEKTAKSFGGVSHRMEFVCEKNGVKFYNGSIDSSPSRTIAALSCFGDEYIGKINLILGGYDKKIPFDSLAKPVCDKKCKIYAAGHTASQIKKSIIESEYFTNSGTKISICENFEHAVNSAIKNANEGEIVLLSPACASFDEFENFEKRGERFKEIVLR